jgi:UDP-N-acetylglucosamine transferase subunit ALG13
MIFVTVGMHNQGFDRLIEKCDLIAGQYVFSLPALRLAFGDCSVPSVPMLPVSS